MRVDREGRNISVRGRQVYMSRQDGTDFLVAVAEAFPDARFFDCQPLRTEARIQEISRDAPDFPDGLWPTVHIFFFGPDWVPKIVPTDDPRSAYIVENFPRLRALIRVDRFHKGMLDEVRIQIALAHQGLLNANHYADGPDGKEGKRIIDKLFRIHRKMSGNRVVPIDLKTGAVTGSEEIDYNWHGIDIARQCLTKKDHYLGLYIDREKEIFRGYRPVKVPGE